MDKVYTLRIVTNYENRIIIEVNGLEIDILSDADGVNIELLNNQSVLESINHDWESE